MTTILQSPNQQAPLLKRRRFRLWFLRRFSVRKPAPETQQPHPQIVLPLQDLRRLAETSPHLLADIGVVAAADATDGAAWRLIDGRHLAPRPPF